MGLGVGVLVGLVVLVAVADFAVPLIIMITPDFVLVRVAVRVVVCVVVGVSVIAVSGVSVGKAATVAVKVLVAVGAAVVGMEVLVQVGGKNTSGVSVAVGSANVGGRLMGRMPAGKTWFGIRKITPKMTAKTTVPVINKIVRIFQIDAFISSALC